MFDKLSTDREVQRKEASEYFLRRTSAHDITVCGRWGDWQGGVT